MNINAVSIPQNASLTQIPDWYTKLLDDLQDLEYKGIVLTKWHIGERICRDELNFNKPEYGDKRIENLAKDTDTTSRELWRCIQFYKKCHDVTQLDDKSWNFIVNKYLPQPKQIIKPTIQLPKGKYNIIYADPPWQYYEGGYKNQSQHYDTYTVQELYDLPIRDLQADNCVLFLWVTFPILDEVFDLVRYWGFDYSTVGFVWVKSKKDGTGHFFGLGNWTRANVELCLIATKGSIERKDASISQIIYEPIGEHSQKPDIVREKIVQLVGDLPRIELFSRKEVPGWDYQGNQKI